MKVAVIMTHPEVPSFVQSPRWHVRLRNARNALVQRRKRLRTITASAYVHPSATVARDLRLDDYAFVGPRCELDPGVEIGRYSMLAPHVAIVGDDHVWQVPGCPIQFSGRPFQSRTIIADDVWIGHGALIRRGVRIGRGAVVAARSVVTADVPEFAVVAGVPARPIGERFADPRERADHIAMLDGPLVAPSFAGALGAADREEAL